MRIPSDWRTILDNLHANGFPEAVIAGGALRDYLLERPVRDVDVFVAARHPSSVECEYSDYMEQTIELTRRRIELALFGDRFPEKRDEEWLSDVRGVWQSSEHLTSDPLYAIQWGRELVAVYDTELRDSTGAKVQVIAVEAPKFALPLRDIRQPRAAFAQRIIDRMDFGLCKIATDGAEVDLISPDFAHDLNERAFTYRARKRTAQQRANSKLRYERLREKYAGFKLVMRRGWFGLALVAALLAPPAHAAEEHTLSTPTDCVPFEPLGKYVKAHGHTIVELDADQRGAVVRFYNAKPPVGDLQPAHVFTARIDTNTLVVFVDAAGCMDDYGLIPNDEFGDWLTEGAI